MAFRLKIIETVKDKIYFGKTRSAFFFFAVEFHSHGECALMLLQSLSSALATDHGDGAH